MTPMPERSPKQPTETHAITAAFPAYVRSHLESLLPSYVDARWYEGVKDAISFAARVEVGWYDYGTKLIEAATGLRWLFTLAAGVEHIPLALLRERGVRVSNGSGLNAANVADYAVMGVIVAAKRFHEVLRAQDRREWLEAAPGRVELEGSRALIVGYGAIGEAVGRRLAALGVVITGVRSKADTRLGILGPDDWRQKIGDFDWIVVAAPATPETNALISHSEIAAMKPTAWLFNVGRGTLIARDALLDALSSRMIGGAFLDVTDPEPLPPDDPLWLMPNAVITMHLSGRSQTSLFSRAAQLFITNLERYVRSEALENEVDLTRGY
jgi:phosphoglycerate dehydrogenase-like enzyme